MGAPTKKPRLMLSVDPLLHATIKRLSELQGRSMAAICTDFLEAAAPALVELVALLERVAVLPEKGRSAVIEAASSAASSLEASVLTIAVGAEEQFELLTAAVSAAENQGREVHDV